MSLLLRKPRPEPEWVTRLEVLERRLKVIEADWDEWYDKFRRLYARLSKRVEREENPPTLTQDARSPRQAGPPMSPLAARLLGTNHGPE